METKSNNLKIIYKEYITNRKIFCHKDLRKERWFTLSFNEQMGNVGAEIGRTINWRNKDKKRSKAAFERGLELFDMTIDDHKNSNKSRELLKIRKSLINYFCSNIEDVKTNKKWDDYFYVFAYASAINRF